MTPWRAVLAAEAHLYGPTTCGCVPLYRYISRLFTVNGRAEFPAWPLCPRCQGTGREPAPPPHA